MNQQGLISLVVANYLHCLGELAQDIRKWPSNLLHWSVLQAGECKFDEKFTVIRELIEENLGVWFAQNELRYLKAKIDWIGTIIKIETF